MIARDWVDNLPPSAPGQLVADQHVLEWSSVELHIRSLDGITLHELAEGQIGQIQLSRGARILPRRWWNRFGWPPRVVQTLEVRLHVFPGRKPSGTRGGLNADGASVEPREFEFGVVASPEILAGLPVLQPADPVETPLVRGVDPGGLIGSLLGMGGTLVFPTKKETLPSADADLAPLHFSPPLRLPAYLIGAALPPLIFLLARSGRLAVLLSGLGLLLLLFLLRHLFFRGTASLNAERTELIVKRGPFSRAQNFPIYVFDHLVTGKNAFGGWIALASGQEMVLLQAGLKPDQTQEEVRQINKSLGWLTRESEQKRRPALTRLLALLVLSTAVLIAGVRLQAEFDGTQDRLLYRWTAAHGTFLDHLQGYLLASPVAAVDGLAISPDGKWLVSRDQRNTVSWNLEEESLQHDQFVAGSSGLAFVAPEEVVSVGPHGTVAVTSSRTGSVVDQWQNVLETGEEELARACGNSQRSFKIAIPNETAVEVWSAAVNIRRAVGPGSGSVRWTGRCQKLLLAQRDSLLVLDLRNGEQTRYQLDEIDDRSLAVDRNGQRAAVMLGGDDESLAVVDLTAGSGQHRQGYLLATAQVDGSGPVLLQMTADGQRIFVSRQYRNQRAARIQVIGAATGELERTLEGPIGMVTSLGVSPDGNWLYAGFDDGSVRGWELDP